MRKIWILGLVGVLSLSLFLAGCGGGGDDRNAVIQTLSDQPVDGDIGFTAPATFVISQANVTNDVQYGLDAGGPNSRRFLTSPSTDPSEAGSFP